MKRVLVLGATGHLGKVLVESLIENKYAVVALVRSPQKLAEKQKDLTIIKGDVTNSQDVKQALTNSNVVMSTLGHGFRTSYPIQEKLMTILPSLMEKRHIKRFITVTGAGLVAKGDPPSLIGKLSEVVLPLIDPYRVHDAQKQQELLERSTLEWTVVRTPIHNNSRSQKITHVGFTQPLPWDTLSRKAIADFMISCIEEDTYICKSPIIY